MEGSIKARRTEFPFYFIAGTNVRLFTSLQCRTRREDCNLQKRNNNSNNNNNNNNNNNQNNNQNNVYNAQIP